MTVELVDNSREPMWRYVPDNFNPDPEDCVSDQYAPLPVVGVDDHPELTVEDALEIADTYGGGEFYNEVAGIVAALCVLRDRVKELP